MVSPEINRILTQSGPGTPAGHVLRQYWQPAALAEELDGDRPAVPVTLMNEELVLFADELGQIGLINHRLGAARVLQSVLTTGWSRVDVVDNTSADVPTASN